MTTESSPSPSPADIPPTVTPAETALAAQASPQAAAGKTPAAALPWAGIAAVALALVALLSLSLAWKTQQRVAALEHTLVSRQEASQREAAQAEMLSKQANDNVLEAAAKVALLEARVAEVAVQRGQFEELFQSLSRSRDENVLLDIEAGIRVALQQTAITGSAEPLVAVLKQSDERLGRYNQPRLEGVRRAIARDLDKVKAVSVADVALLSVKLDEAVRMIDDLPLLSRPDFRRPGGAGAAGMEAAAPRAPQKALEEAAREPREPVSGWSLQAWAQRWDRWSGHVLAEAKSLVRVTRIDHPEAMLLAPEQAFFLRENLKLRLLNARLALLSRQFETAQSDLQQVQAALDRYFDRQNRRTAAAAEAVRSVASQARQVVVPRPDNTLAALSAAGTGR